MTPRFFEWTPIDPRARTVLYLPHKMRTILKADTPSTPRTRIASLPKLSTSRKGGPRLTKSCTRCGASFWVARGKPGRQRSRCDACRTHHARIDGKKWRELRRRFLAENPVCAYCGGPAVEVDHVQPLSLGGSPYDLWNLAPSCKRCNSSKGQRLAAAARREQRVTTLKW